jgi:DNA-binding response OmpR family regulator
MAKVLVVDDEPDIRALIEVRLTHQGHEVVSVACAAEALAAIELNGEPDIAVVDIVMPDISGIELLTRLRECSCPRMSAVFLTARCLDSDLDSARALNAGYLRKPFRFAALEDAMRKELQFQAC